MTRPVRSEAVIRYLATLALAGCAVTFALLLNVPVLAIVGIGMVVAGIVTVALWKRHFDAQELDSDRRRNLPDRPYGAPSTQDESQY